ncbi:MAG: MMPL family transporter [Acidimicrobiales bacterium]
MFTRLGRLAVRRRGLVLVATIVVIAAALVVGVGVIDRLAGSGFDDPDADSVAARTQLEETFDTGFTDAAFLLTVRDPGPDEPAVDRADVVAAGQAFTAEIAALPGTDDVVSYWSAESPEALRSTDGTRALVLLRFPGEADDPVREALSIRLTEDFVETPRGPLDVRIGGRDPVFERIGMAAERDLAMAELIAVPLTLILLLVVFRTIVAALIPAVVGVATMIGALLVLFLITQLTDVSIFAINLVATLGLGLAIDYSLLIVNRYREERARGLDVDDAVVTTVGTAGRTVAFSGLTVAVSLSALLVFPIYFLRSFAYAGIGVVGFALLLSVVALPATLSLLGDRIEAGAIRPHRSRRHGISIWRAQADRVVDHPWRYLVVGTILLGALAVPFAGVEWGESDHRSLPPGDEVRATTELMTTEFDAAEMNAFPVVATGGVTADAITKYALEISQLPGVQRVDTANGAFVGGASIVPGDEATTARFLRDDATWFNVVPGVEPISAEAERLVETLRRGDSPFDEVLIGGGTAGFIDTKAAILDNLALAAALLFGATFVLLFLMFGSLLVPLKAIVLNLLSLGATFGVLIVVFQDGLFESTLGFTATGFTDISTPVLVFGIAFGLSMDYEVFLLSRIKEEYDRAEPGRAGRNENAIVDGIDRTGPLITAAALLLTVTFLATAASSLSFLKLFGIGLAVAVVVDAFLVRVTIVPALMAVAGKWNWWAPAPLRSLHDRWGFADHDTEPVIDLADEIDLRDTIDLTDEGDLADEIDLRPGAHDLTS